MLPPSGAYWCDGEHAAPYSLYTLDIEEAFQVGVAPGDDAALAQYCLAATDDLFLAYCYASPFAAQHQSQMDIVFFYVFYWDLDGKLGRVVTLQRGPRTCSAQ